MDTKALGQKGELLAKSFLENQGFEIVKQNVMLPGGEIDIVARKGNTIAIIEVKTSFVTRFGETAFAPELRVNTRKQHKLIKLGKLYLASQKMPAEHEWEIDIVGVEINSFGGHEVHLWRQAVTE